MRRPAQAALRAAVLPAPRTHRRRARPRPRWRLGARPGSRRRRALHGAGSAVRHRAAFRAGVALGCGVERRWAGAGGACSWGRMGIIPRRRNARRCAVPGAGLDAGFHAGFSAGFNAVSNAGRRSAGPSTEAGRAAADARKGRQQKPAFADTGGCESFTFRPLRQCHPPARRPGGPSRRPWLGGTSRWASRWASRSAS